MIDHLRGRLSGGGKDFVVLECAGIGFRAHVSAATRKELPPDGEGCLLRTHLHFREGGADLYGFSSETEREIFLATIGVSGVLAACAREDAAAFTRVPGIGKKLAQRIALELPDRLKRVSVEFALAAGEDVPLPTAPEGQAAEALAALGFSRAEAQLAVAAARREKGAEQPADALIREALRRLSGARG